MTEINSRKPKVTCTTKLRLDYAKRMMNEGYTNKQIMEISGASKSAVRRWKKQYLDEDMVLARESTSADTSFETVI